MLGSIKNALKCYGTIAYIFAFLMISAPANAQRFFSENTRGEKQDFTEADWAKFVTRDPIYYAEHIRQFLYKAADVKSGPAFISMVQKYRSQMTPEFRWILAAAEISHKIENPQTQQDAIDGLRLSEVKESTDMRIGPKNSLSSLFHYKIDHENKERYFVLGVSEILFLNRNWLRAAHRSGQLPPAWLDAKKVAWMEAITTGAFQVNSRELVAILHDLDQSRSFSTPQASEAFLAQAARLSQRLGFPMRIGSDIESFIANTLRRWFAEDISYLLKNFDHLRRRGLTSTQEMFSRSVSPGEFEVISNLFTSRKLPLDSHLIAGIMWIQHQGTNPSSRVDAQAAKEVIDILFNVSKQMDGYRLSYLGFQSQHITSVEIISYIETIYKAFKTNATLTKENAVKLLKQNTLRTVELTDADWVALEWQRLECVERGMPANEFKEALIERLITDSYSLHDRLLAANYLRRKLKVEDTEFIAKRLKAKAENVSVEKYQKTSNRTWDRANHLLVTVMMAFDPKDADLRNYLSELYVTKNIDSTIGSESALEFLVKTGQANESVREEIARRMQFVSNGDSAGTLSAFAKLFPTDGETIVRVVYGHSNRPEKLIPILRALIDVAIEHPQLLAAIEHAVRVMPDRTAARHTYQGQNLAVWLQNQVNQKNAAAKAAAINCSRLIVKGL